MSTKGIASRTLIVWGGTGQAKVLRPIIEARGHQVGCVYDRNPHVAPPFEVLMFHDQAELWSWVAASRPAREIGFVAAIGGFGRARLDVAKIMHDQEIKPVILVHPRAWVAQSATIGDGAQICAMASVGEEVELGRQCLINTGAVVDHECRLGDGVHIMPGARLAGCVVLGVGAGIGAGATVLPRITIGADARIGAGAVVTKDVAPGTTVVGIPAHAL